MNFVIFTKSVWFIIMQMYNVSQISALAVAQRVCVYVCVCVCVLPIAKTYVAE